MRKKIILTTPYPTQEEIIETYGITKAETKRVNRFVQLHFPELGTAVSRHGAKSDLKSRSKQAATHARKKTA